MGRLDGEQARLRELLADLVDRGLDCDQGVLVVLDGGKALRTAVAEVFGHVPVQRCVRHYADARVMPTRVRRACRWSRVAGVSVGIIASAGSRLRSPSIREESVMNDPSRVRVRGPLEAFAPGFVAELGRLGYSPVGATLQLRLMARASRWLEGRGSARRG